MGSQRLPSYHRTRKGRSALTGERVQVHCAIVVWSWLRWYGGLKLFWVSGKMVREISQMVGVGSSVLCRSGRLAWWEILEVELG